MIFKDQPNGEAAKVQTTRDEMQCELTELYKRLREQRSDAHVTHAWRLIGQCLAALEYGSCSSQLSGLLLAAVDNMHPVQFADDRQRLHHIIRQLTPVAENRQLLTRDHAA
jgi:hypothetical protein